MPLFLFICLFVFSWMENPVRAEEAPVEESVAPAPAEDAAANGGEVLFFPERAERPLQERHEVLAGGEVSVCLKLPRSLGEELEKLRAQLIGYRVILEDDSVPPQRLVAEVLRQKSYLVPDESGCLLGSFPIDRYQSPSVYQAADLLIKTSSGSYLSLREPLYHFSRAEELKLAAPERAAKAPPELLGIATYNKPEQRKIRYTDTLRIKIRHVFTFAKDKLDLKRDSFQAFYRLTEDDQSATRYKARCRKATMGASKVSCLMDLRQPRENWRFTRVNLNLESVDFEDVAGHAYHLEGAELANKAHGQPLDFNFLGATETLMQKAPVYQRLRTRPY